MCNTSNLIASDKQVGRTSEDKIYTTAALLQSPVAAAAAAALTVPHQRSIPKDQLLPLVTL